MKIDELLNEKNSGVTHTAAYEKGCTAAQLFLDTHGQHKGKAMPTCEYEEHSEQYRAWHEGFKNTVHGSEWFDGG